MQIILSGKYESALVRMIDADLSPNRNTTGHEYYADLNRNTDKHFVDGAGTFVSITNETYVPWELDWNYPYPNSYELDIRRTARPEDREDRNSHYKQVDSLIDGIIKRRILSTISRHYIQL
jgi:hypothetical protein